MPILCIQGLLRCLELTFLFARVCIEYPFDMGKLGDVFHRMLRRLEDRIRYLCRKALTARDDELGSLF